jgi:hypothetical protein
MVQPSDCGLEYGTQPAANEFFQNAVMRKSLADYDSPQKLFTIQALLSTVQPDIARWRPYEPGFPLHLCRSRQRPFRDPNRSGQRQ